MKTVQYYVQTLDKEWLIHTYLEMFPIPYEKEAESEPANHLTVSEIRKAHETALSDYIERLKAMEAVPEDEEYIFIAEVIPGEFDEEIRYGMLVKSELLEKGLAAEVYDFYLEGQARIIGRYVADSAMTQKHIYKVIAAILYEISFFGFNEEKLEEERRSFAEALKETEEIMSRRNDEIDSSDRDQTVFLDAVSKVKVLDLEEIQPDKELRALEGRLHKSRLDYTTYLREKEIREVLEEIRKEG